MTLGELREALLGLGAPDLCVSPAGPLIIDVALGDRHQKVRIAADREEWFRASSRICSLDELGMRGRDFAEEVFRHDHEREFLAFGRAGAHVIGWIDLPRDISVDELMVQVRRLAAACDRWEARLVGEDA